MSKDFKVRRYGRDRRRQRKVNAAKVILLVAVIAAACLAGWYRYDPVSAWVSEKAAQWQLQREQREQERAQEQQNQQNQQNQQGEPGGQEEPDGTTPTILPAVSRDQKLEPAPPCPLCACLCVE